MNDFSCEPHVVIGDSLDELIQKGVLLIEETGEDIKVRAGTGKQSYSVIYVLKNSRRRLHLLSCTHFDTVPIPRTYSLL